MEVYNSKEELKEEINKTYTKFITKFDNIITAKWLHIGEQGIFAV